ncbi:MAG: Ig-like domain-containing protein, partial [Acidobacteriota bacterium]
MFNLRNLWMVALALVLLVACSGGANPIPPSIQTAVPQLATSLQQAAPTPTANAPFPQGITNEPLGVVTTSPADKSEEVQVTKETARIIVQFNHPVVPLVAVEAQKDLPQPLTLQPAVPGSGQWINTSTFAFMPSQNLAVATPYTASLAPLKDMLGQSLSGFSWTFKTASPAVLKTDPADNTQYVAPSQPITITFNTEMDRASTESRLTVKRADTGAVPAGRFEWQGTVLRFIPTAPLEYDQSYKATLVTGAQDAKQLAATVKDVTWTFRTVAKPGVLSTIPQNGNTSASMADGLRLNFASPMNQESLKVTVQPTITNQTLWWEGDKVNRTDTSTIAHVGGQWQASTPYTVTIGSESPTRYGEKLGKDVVVRFTTAPRSPELFLNVPGDLGMYDVNGPQTIVASYVNLNQIDYKLYKVDRADFVGLLGRNYYQSLQKFTPKETNQLRAWSQKPSAPLNATRLISTTLTAGGTPLPAGVYMLQATAPAITASDLRQPKHILVVSGLNLAFKRTQTEALVWVTDLKSGKPVADQPLTLYSFLGSALASGKSDKDGLWRAKFNSQNVWDPTYVLSEAGGQIVAAVGSDWSDGIMSWDFNMPRQPETRDYYANLYTDRAIYRPGQTIYFRGVLRRDNDAQYSLPQGIETVPLKVRDGQGRQIATQNATLTRFGTFNGEIKLSDSASIGYYNLSLELGADPRKFVESVNFQVAEYRAPQFQVGVKTDQTEYYNGDKIKVDATATYFFGGPVKDANVTWRLMSDDLAFQPDNVKGWWDFVDYDLSQRQHQGGVVREGKGKTDANGTFHFETAADLKDYPLSQNFTLEAEIVDINNQSVSSRTVVPVHKGKYYIGLRPQRYVGTVGQEQAADVITVNTKGAAVPNQALTVSFFEHQWYSVREKRDDGGLYWKSAYTDTLVSKVNVTSDAQGQAVAKFTPAKGGIFKIVAEGKDANNNAIRSATYLWVSGREFINWRMENNDRIDLVADKKQYTVGETADILIPAPFKDSEALLTVERGTIREVRRLTLPGNSERIKIPIQPDYAPNVFVSIMLVKGRGADSPTP